METLCRGVLTLLALDHFGEGFAYSLKIAVDDALARVHSMSEA